MAYKHNKSLNKFYVNDLSGGTIYSGSTDLSEIFAPIGEVGDITRVEGGTNISTGGTENNPIINLDDDIFVNDITVSGTGEFAAITSGGTPLESIIENIALENGDITRVEGGANISTGGTDNNPIINLDDDIFVNDITVSGTGEFNAITSGGTPLEDIFLTEAPDSDITRVEGGTNISTGGTDNNPVINLDDDIFLNDITVSGTGEFNAITSGGTPLEEIIENISIESSLWQSGTSENSILMPGNSSSGENSLAIGDGSNASGDNSMAGGSSAVANGDNAFALGDGAKATSNAFVAGGQNNEAGPGSFATGNKTYATGFFSHTKGKDNTASGAYSSAGGYKSTASGYISFVHASASTNASEASAILGGDGNTLTSSADRSVILGGQNITGTDSDTVYGINFAASGVITSGGTDLSDIFLTEAAESDITRVEGGTNISTGGTDNNPVINLDDDIFVNDITVSGTGEFAAITSGGTPLEDIIENIALENGDITRVEGGTNISTGGTDNNPVINLDDDIFINDITVSGTGEFAAITSGGTPLEDIIENISFENALWQSGTGINSILMPGSPGGSNLANGESSLAIGSLNSSSGEFSFAGGENSSAAGKASFAFGYTSSANDPYSFAAGGYYSNAYKGSFATGRRTYAKGKYSFTSGVDNYAVGDYSMVGGSGSYSESTDSFIHGKNGTIALGANSSAILGGEDNTLSPLALRSVILGGQNITGTDPDTVYGINFAASGVITSGGTDLSDIFLTEAAESDITRVEGGTNISTGGTDNNPIINLDDNIFVNDITVSGTGEFAAITSGGTPLEDIIENIALENGDITRVEGGTNISTGGTDNNPIINLDDNIFVNDITVSGTGEFATITSGGTDLSDIFSDISADISDKYDKSGGTIDGSVFVTGNLDVFGTATTLNTETVRSKDNNIELNFGGNHSSALGGGITVLSGVSNLIDSTLTVDGDGKWSASTEFLAAGGLDVINGNAMSSGGTNLYDIFLTEAEESDVTRVEGGTNISTGGTDNNPIINLDDDIFVNDITVSGTGEFAAITSGGTPLEDIIESITFDNALWLSGTGVNSIVMPDTGNNNVASGTGSIALGSGTVASGYNTFAGGDNTSASGPNSFAFGYNCSADVGYSFAAGGYYASASNGSFATGSNVGASGKESFVSGSLNQVNADQASILGGANNSINTDALRSAILGGESNTLNSAAIRSVILGGQNITGTAPDTVYGINFAASGVITSGGTDLSELFLTEAAESDITRVEGGTNISTGGTDNNPVINLDDDIFVNDITVSGTGEFATITSGSTNLYDIFEPIGANLENIVEATSGTFTLPDDEGAMILSNFTSGVQTINLPSNPPNGSKYTVKDITGDAVSNNIIITTSGGSVNIDGETDDVIDEDYASATYVFYNGEYFIK